MSNYKLSLLSKRLGSGKCQIKFIVTEQDAKIMHGYMLSDANSTLKDVVHKIEERVKISTHGDQLHHSHLYDLTSSQLQQDIVVFKN